MKIIIEHSIKNKNTEIIQWSIGELNRDHILNDIQNLTDNEIDLSIRVIKKVIKNLKDIKNSNTIKIQKEINNIIKGI